MHLYIVQGISAPNSSDCERSTIPCDRLENRPEIGQALVMYFDFVSVSINNTIMITMIVIRTFCFVLPVAIGVLVSD